MCLCGTLVAPSPPSQPPNKTHDYCCFQFVDDPAVARATRRARPEHTLSHTVRRELNNQAEINDERRSGLLGGVRDSVNRRDKRPLGTTTASQARVEWVAMVAVVRSVVNLSGGTVLFFFQHVCDARCRSPTRRVVATAGLDACCTAWRSPPPVLPVASQRELHGLVGDGGGGGGDGDGDGGGWSVIP